MLSFKVYFESVHTCDHVQLSLTVLCSLVCAGLFLFSHKVCLLNMRKTNLIKANNAFSSLVISRYTLFAYTHTHTHTHTHKHRHVQNTNEYINTQTNRDKYKHVQTYTDIRKHTAHTKLHKDEPRQT